MKQLDIDVSRPGDLPLFESLIWPWPMWPWSMWPLTLTRDSFYLQVTPVNGLFSVNQQNLTNTQGVPNFSKKGVSLVSLCAPWRTTRFTGAQCSSVVHKVALYHCTGAQCRPHEPKQTGRWTDRKQCVWAHCAIAQAGSKRKSNDIPAWMK